MSTRTINIPMSVEVTRERDRRQRMWFWRLVTPAVLVFWGAVLTALIGLLR